MALQKLSAREQLKQHGLVRFENILGANDIDHLRLISEAVLYRTGEKHRERFLSNGSLCNVAELPEYANLIADPRIISLLEQLGGSDIRWTSGYLISKPPGGPPLFWHQDWWGWGNDYSYQPDPAQLFVMIYLTNTVQENGCLRVIPGTHVYQHELHALPAAHTKAIATEVSEHSKAYASHPDEVAVQVSAGDVLIGDSRLLHSAYANHSEHERPLLTLWYIPNYRDLPAPLQSTIQAIYQRQVVDIDENATDLPTCDNWPRYALNKIRHLIPQQFSKATAQPWERIPDQSRMLKT